MKVVHISYNDMSGGAGIAAYRHHESMLLNGIDSKMLVVNKKTSDSSVIQLKGSKYRNFFDKVINKCITLSTNYFASWSFGLLGNDLSSNELIKSADVVVLHWINKYMITIDSIEKILKTGKKVIWFMHDMWPITGGCHHALDCNRYMSHCHSCPMAHNYRGSKLYKDLSYHQFNQKVKKLSPYSNLIFVTPSSWLADCVRKSKLFGDHKVYVVRNVLNTHVFSQRDKTEARKSLGLPKDRKLLLFGADNIYSPYKGWKLLRDALTEPIDGVDIVIYGNDRIDISSEIKNTIHNLGHISDLSRLIDLYSACDLFISPSIADNYPNVLIEAMACGLPCIGTNVGGIPEIIIDRVSGRISAMDSSSLRLIIIEMMNSQILSRYSNSCIQQINKENSYQEAGLKLANVIGLD